MKRLIVVLRASLVHRGFDSNGSNEVRHTWAWSIAGGKVVCGLVPGGTPVLPGGVQGGVDRPLGEARPGLQAGLHPPRVGLGQRVAQVIPARHQRLDQVGPAVLGRRGHHLHAAAPPGLFHVGSVSASQVKPPP